MSWQANVCHRQVGWIKLAKDLAEDGTCHKHLEYVSDYIAIFDIASLPPQSLKSGTAYLHIRFVLPLQ